MSETSLVEHLRAIRRTLRERDLVARKRLGQHFLLDAHLLRRIVTTAGPVEGRSVIEVGPGPGGLTAALLEAGAGVLGIELDEAWAGFNESHLSAIGPLEILREDARARDGAALNDHVSRLADRDGRRPLFVSNLPYQVASPLLIDLMHANVPPERAVVMVQKEVAMRLAAGPGTRERGLLSVLVQAMARVRRAFGVPAGAFTPPPRVDSAIVVLEPEEVRRKAFRAHPGMGDLMRRAFQERRKMLRRSLREALDGREVELPDGLLERRPEQLELEEWYRLAGAITGDSS